MATRFLITLLVLFGTITHGLGQTIYENNSYRFRAKIPIDWTLYGEIKNDTVKNYSIVGWGLPKVYSDLEKTEIENAISITGYKRKNKKYN
jgi:hypothetical protein